MNLTINDIIREAKQGNQKAFTILFYRYNKNIFNYINSIVKNSTESEDLMMMTFEKAFEKLGKYIVLCEFQTWLIEIARNACFDFLRRKRSFIDLNHNIKCQIENPEERLISKQSGEILDKAVSSLNDNYRSIIELKYYEDLSYHEICARLGIKENIACRRVFFARRNLTKILIA